MANKQKFTGVSAVEKSDNSKIGTVAATYVAQESCPNDCPFMGSGCYAENGMVAFQTRRLNKEAAETTALELANSEAAAIRGLSGKLPLRLHVVGDCKTDAAARAVSSAAYDYTAKHGRIVWSYTHAWRNVARNNWNGVSILASCETVADAKQAMDKGYAAAIVTTKHADTKAYIQDGVKVIPCPQQTGKTANCESCKLCFNADRLHSDRAVIAFETHGNVKRANNALIQLGAN